MNHGLAGHHRQEAIGLDWHDGTYHLHKPIHDQADEADIVEDIGRCNKYIRHDEFRLTFLSKTSLQTT